MNIKPYSTTWLPIRAARSCRNRSMAAHSTSSTLSGMRASPNGTRRPTTLELAPGVVVRIPAGVPHVIRPIGGAPLVYLVLKEHVSGSATAAKAP